MTQKRIAILTGGGDVPGLNSVIKSVVYRATEMGYEAIGVRRGWEGLTHLTCPSDGGPELHPPPRSDQHADDRSDRRTDPPHLADEPAQDAPAAMPAAIPVRVGRRWRSRRIFDVTPVVLENLEALGIDVLVTIGGDDTLSYPQVLANAGVPLVAIPKTMDNDVQGTEYCIGFSTAITRAKEAINRQRRRSARTSGSACSASSGATPGSRRCTRRTSPRRAASSRRSATTSTRWPRARRGPP